MLPLASAETAVWGAVSFSAAALLKSCFMFQHSLLLGHCPAFSGPFVAVIYHECKRAEKNFMELLSLAKPQANCPKESGFLEERGVESAAIIYMEISSWAGCRSL